VRGIAQDTQAKGKRSDANRDISVYPCVLLCEVVFGELKSYRLSLQET
jgi:hypothetical protein